MTESVKENLDMKELDLMNEEFEDFIQERKKKVSG